MRIIKARGIYLSIIVAAYSTLAHAAPVAYDLRFFELETASTFQVTGTQSALGTDAFTNGNPLTGINYQRSFNGTPDGGPVAGGYTASPGFSAGAELTGAASDLIGTQFGAGALSFRFGDAALGNNNLTPTGFNNYSLSLTTQPDGTGTNAYGLVSRDGRFTVFNLWNLTVPDAGGSVLLSIGGTGLINAVTGTRDYVDRLNLRFGSDYLTGTPQFTFEQQSRSGTTVSRSILGGLSLADLYPNWSDADYFALEFDRDLPTAADPNPGVRATIRLFDASLDATGDLQLLTSFNFGVLGSTFLTGGAAGQFSNVFAQANWLERAPVVGVPEPGTYALMACGLGAVAFVRRRRRS